MTRATLSPTLTRPADRIDTAFDAIERTALLMFKEGVPARPGRMIEWLQANGRGSWVNDFRFDHLRDELEGLYRAWRTRLLEKRASTFVLAVLAGFGATTFYLTHLWGMGCL